MQNKFWKKRKILDGRGGCLERSKVCLFLNYLCTLIELMRQDERYGDIMSDGQ